MALTTANVPFDAVVFDNSVTDPRVVLKLLPRVNLHGLEGALWEKFRYPEGLSDDQRRAALLNKVRLQREELACLLFDAFIQVLKLLKFKYSYTQNMSVFSDEFAVEGTDLSCLGCTRSFAGLLHLFNFEPHLLKCQKSNPRDDDNLKVVLKPAFEKDKVRGHDGRDVAVAYDPDTMGPTGEELSNGFKLITYPSGGFGVRMTRRDPFLNHFCVFVDAPGLKCPYFDPLTGARYENGQSDLFAGYERSPALDFSYGAERVVVHARAELPRARLYSIPAILDFDRNPDFIKGRAKYTQEGLKLWLLIDDPDDWRTAVPVTAGRPRANANAAALPPTGNRPRANAMTAQLIGQHPALIQQLFRLG